MSCERCFHSEGERVAVQKLPLSFPLSLFRTTSAMNEIKINLLLGRDQERYEEEYLQNER
jgi:hypothetical protein